MDRAPLKIAVVGTGYVGLVTGTCLTAMTSHEVVCLDTDQGKIARLARREIPIYEPGLKELVERGSEAGRLKFSTDAGKAMADADVIFIAVGTPQGEDGSADLSYVKAAARTIGQAITKPATVVIKSTVPVGTGAVVEKIISDLTKTPVRVVSNPEFLKEGDAVRDFMNPDRVVIGTTDSETEALMRRVYAPIASNKIVVMSPASAELTKLAANAMLATRIGFINELSTFAARMGANIEDVSHGVGLDSRVGPRFLKPGPGYGGSCFPKDLLALIHAGSVQGTPQTILSAVHSANQRHKHVLADMVVAKLGNDLQGRKIAVWGLAFKADTDDVRESPALTVIRDLERLGAEVHASDPKANDAARRVLGDTTTLHDDPYAALQGADALVIVTEWAAFRAPDFGRIKALLKTGPGARPLVFDGRNLFEPQRMDRLGFDYESIGRRSVGVHLTCEPSTSMIRSAMSKREP